MSNSFLNVFPECYIDTYFVMWLLQTDKVNHQSSCNNVVGAMRQGRFSIGIVDYDKNKKEAYNRYWTLLMKGTEQNLNLLFFRHPREPHYLITVNPAMDSFVLECAKNLGVSPEAFGLPSSPEEFYKLTKDSEKTLKDIRFKRLFNSIQPHPSIITFKCVMQYLLKNEYNSSDKEIQDIIASGIALMH